MLQHNVFRKKWNQALSLHFYQQFCQKRKNWKSDFHINKCLLINFLFFSRLPFLIWIKKRIENIICWIGLPEPYWNRNSIAFYLHGMHLKHYFPYPIFPQFCLDIYMQTVVNLLPQCHFWESQVAAINFVIFFLQAISEWKIWMVPTKAICSVFTYHLQLSAQHPPQLLLLKYQLGEQMQLTVERKTF